MSERRKLGTLQKEMELVTEELKKSGTWTPPAGYGSGGDSSAGNSSYESGTSGKANTGGGGAGKWGGETGQAGSGGSGIIILRYYKYKE